MDLKQKEANQCSFLHIHGLHAVKELPQQIWKRKSRITHRAQQKRCARLLSLKPDFWLWGQICSPEAECIALIPCLWPWGQICSPEAKYGAISMPVRLRPALCTCGQFWILGARAISLRPDLKIWSFEARLMAWRTDMQLWCQICGARAKSGALRSIYFKDQACAL